MDEESLISLRNFQDENGFKYRKQLKKHRIRVMNKLPFCLIASNEQLSQSLFGTSQVQCLNFDIPNIELKNTNYVSLDYEKYCNQPKVEQFTKRNIALKKTNNTINTSDKIMDFNLRRSSRFFKRSIKECSVRINELKICDILNYKLSKESRKFVEELARKDVPIRKKTMAIVESEDDDIIILSEDEPNDINDLSSTKNTHYPNNPLVNEIAQRTPNETNSKTGNLTNNSQLQNRMNYDLNRVNSSFQKSNKIYHFSKDNFENFVIKRPINKQMNNSHPYNRVKKARFNIQSFGKALSYHHYNKYLTKVDKRKVVNKMLLQYKPIAPLNLKLVITNTTNTQKENTATFDKANSDENSQRDKIEIDVIDLTI